MKILVIDHSNKDYSPNHINGAWQFLTHNFKLLGHEVCHVMKKEWIWYPFIYMKFKPDVVISVQRIAGLITGLHHKIAKKALFVHDVTDHPHFYKSERRIKFLVKSHDITVSTSKYNVDKYKLNHLIPNGSNFTPIKAKPEYDACYLGQIHSFYGIKKIQQKCKQAGISLKLIHDTPTEQVPEIIAKSKICILPISWDSCTKMCDYAAMAKPTVALKPNLAEKINFPAYYSEDIVSGIQYLLKHPNQADALGKNAYSWFLKFSGNWKHQAEIYIAMLTSELKKHPTSKTSAKV